MVPCHARLGETYEQCVNRYDSVLHSPSTGEVMGAKTMSVEFAKSGYFIDVSFLDDVSASETFSKIDKSDFTEIEKKTLLDANAGNGKWTPSTEPSADEIWIRDDGAIARYDLFKRCLSIFSKQFIEKMRTKAEAEQKAKLKDF